MASLLNMGLMKQETFCQVGYASWMSARIADPIYRKRSWIHFNCLMEVEMLQNKALTKKHQLVSCVAKVWNVVVA